MNEIRFTNKIRQALNEGARLDGPARAPVAQRLRAARERALALKKPDRVPAFGWARISSSGELVGGFDAFSGLGSFLLRVLLPTVLLLAGLFGIYSWQQEQRATDIEELDAQLLTDDLPIDAYLDRGFEAWLKKVSGN